jgi:protein SCO1/2
LKKALLKLN